MFIFSTRSTVLSRDGVARAQLDEMAEQTRLMRAAALFRTAPRHVVDDAAAQRELAAQQQALSGSHAERKAALAAIRAAASGTG